MALLENIGLYLGTLASGTGMGVPDKPGEGRGMKGTRDNRNDSKADFLIKRPLSYSSGAAK